MKILFFIIFCTLNYSWLQAWAENPWSTSDYAPVIEEILRLTPQNDKTLQNDQSNKRFDYGFYFYEKFLSPADGARCGMYPTCADYGYQAIQKHGPMVGGWMATDRFMRDNGHGDSFYSLIEKFGKRRLFDPVSANDFWF